MSLGKNRSVASILMAFALISLLLCSGGTVLSLQGPSVLEGYQGAHARGSWSNDGYSSGPIDLDCGIQSKTANHTSSEFTGIYAEAWWPYCTCNDVAYDQLTGLLVIGSGGVLQLLDVSNLSRPVKVNELFLEGQHQYIAVSEGIAYVTTFRRSGLQIINISDPLNLRTIGFYPTEGDPQGIEVVGGTAYLAAGQALDIVDVSNPDLPHLEARYQVEGQAAHTSISNSKLYLTVWSRGRIPASTGPGGVYVIDIISPSSPNLLGFFASPNVAHFAVLGNIALLSEWQTNNLQILDVSNDTSFVRTSILELNMTGDVADVEFSGSLAFVSGGYLDLDHLIVINLSNPTGPAIIGSIGREESTVDRGQHYLGGGPIILVGDILFQASWTCGVGIFDVSHPESLRIIRSFDTPDPYMDVSISGHIACIADQSDGLRLLDISDPLNIVEIGSLSPGMADGTFLQVCTDTQYAYVATEGHGIQIFDIVRPNSPLFVGSLDTPGIARGITLSNGFAYVADSEGGLRVIDVHAPSSPTEIGFLLFSASATRVAVSRGYAYVATDDGHLQIVDASNPALLRLRGVFNVPHPSSSISCLVALENELYLGTDDSRIYRLDISNPGSPRLESSIWIPDCGPLEDISISQGRAYVASLPFGLRVLNVTESESMSEIAYYQVPGWGRGVDIAAGYIFLACGDAGLLILKLDTVAPTTTLSIGTPKHITTTATYVSDLTQLTLLGADNPQGSGVKETKFRVDGGVWTFYTGPFTLAAYGHGAHAIGYMSTDNTLNSEAERTTTVFLDNTGPSVNLGSRTSPVHGESVTISASITDDGSGVNSVVLEYSTDGSTWTTVPMTQISGTLYQGSIPGQDVLTTVHYQVQATDELGNTSASSSATYSVGIPTLWLIAGGGGLLLLALLLLMRSLMGRRAPNADRRGSQSEG